MECVTKMRIATMRSNVMRSTASNSSSEEGKWVRKWKGQEMNFETNGIEMDFEGRKIF